MGINILTFDSYIATIQNSIGSKSFQTLWAEVHGAQQDILGGGQYSCGVFVSGILIWFDLIQERHATVLGTVRGMKASGWEEIKEPKVGCVLHWERQSQNGSANEHLGFYMGHETAISNSGTDRVPVEHHFTYGATNGIPNRSILAMYWHPSLS